MHKALENYFLRDEGFPTAVASIAASALPHLPDRRTLPQIEHRFEFAGTHARYNGLIDLLIADPVQPRVYDHKTTKDFRYAKTPEVLRDTDPQGVVYARAAFEAFPAAQDVMLQWTYLRTTDPGVRPVITWVTRSHNSEKFAALESITERLGIILASAPPEGASREETAAYVKSLPFNSGACRDYGGCPYEHLCALTPGERMRGSIREMQNHNGTPVNPTDALIATLSAQQMPLAPPVPPPVVTPGGTTTFLPSWASAPAAPPAPPPPAIMPAYAAPTPPPAPVAAYVAPPAPIPPPAYVTPAPIPTHPQDPINPPERLLSPPVQAAPIPPPVAQGQAAPAATEAPKRARRTKAQMQAATGQGAVPHATSIPAGRIETLYIDCLPISGEIVTLDDLLVPVKAALARGGLADYRFAEFGRGTGLLVQVLGASLDAQAGIDAVFVSTRSTEGMVCVNDLAARASFVVRGCA